MKFLFLFFLFHSLNLSLAEQEVQQSLIGEERAVLKYSENDGIVLSLDAKNKIGLIAQELGRDYSISKDALIYELNSIGVYINNGKWLKFEFVSVVPFQKSVDRVVIKGPEIRPGSKIITKGAGLLRLAELNISNPGAEDD